MTDESTELPGVHPVDVHVGACIHLRRKVLGMSPAHLAGLLDLTIYQLEKYESGEERISAARLYAVAVVLGVSVSFFFEGLVTPGADAVDGIALAQDLKGDAASRTRKDS